MMMLMMLSAIMSMMDMPNMAIVGTDIGDSDNDHSDGGNNYRR